MRKHCTDLPLAQVANGFDIVIVRGNFKEEGSGPMPMQWGFDELLGLEQGGTVSGARWEPEAARKG